MKYGVASGLVITRSPFLKYEQLHHSFYILSVHLFRVALVGSPHPISLHDGHDSDPVQVLGQAFTSAVYDVINRQTNRIHGGKYPPREGGTRVFSLTLKNSRGLFGLPDSNLLKGCLS